MRHSIALFLFGAVAADRPADLIKYLPDFEGNASTWGFKAYSGLLEVPGPINGYDSLRIHYQFHTSQKAGGAKGPVVAWHNGGPLSSSVSIGTYNEMGAFVLGQDANYINPYAWNREANMLYLESPAGSCFWDFDDGYSSCRKNGQRVRCDWNDVSQGEAYAHTLKAFFASFPEYEDNDLFLVGESYAGQYIPNIASFILKHENDVAQGLNLKGIAIGNGCGLGNETLVACVGPSNDLIDVNNFYGKGLFSPKLKKQIDAECDWPTVYTTGDDTDPSGWAGRQSLSPKCRQLLEQMQAEVGPHDIYNIYDTCPYTEDFFSKTGKDRAWLKHFLRSNMHDQRAAHQTLLEMNGGYRYDCLSDASVYLKREDVKKALHLDGAVGSSSGYKSTGPASVVLYPELVKRLRVLIYAGDADACVPYNGNYALVEELESRGAIEESNPWTPWFASSVDSAPAGYITKYRVPGSQDSTFFFQTVRLAGHMVPQYMPASGLELFRNFLAGESPARMAV